MKATEEYFPLVLFIFLYKMFLTFESVEESLDHPLLGVTIPMKPTEQYFHVAWFIMRHNVVLTFEPVDEILNPSFLFLFVATPADEPFSCPACYAEGENALQDCDDRMDYAACKGENPVCYVSTNKAGDFVGRGCYTEEYFYKKKARCERKGTCVVAMCAESRCKANLPQGE